MPVSRREAWLQALLVFAVALVVRVLAASIVVFPQPEDTAYYVGVARNLSRAGPDEQCDLELPDAAAGLPAAGVRGLAAAADVPRRDPDGAARLDVRGAQWSAVLVGSVVPVLAWRIGLDAAAGARPVHEPRPRPRVGAGLTAAVYLPLVLHSALPDSTMPFAVLALAACWLMPRLLRARGARGSTDWRLIGLGVLIGLAALTRNEAAFVGFAWVVVVVGAAGRAGPPEGRADRGAGVVALAVFAPWMVRNWIAFGNPLPGQALANALSVTGFDIFAWNDPPTLSRYLAVGPAGCSRCASTGLSHNLFTVLLIPGIPTSFIGLSRCRGSPARRARAAAAGPVGDDVPRHEPAVPGVHDLGHVPPRRGPAHVLLIVAACSALDAFIAWVGGRARLDAAGRLARRRPHGRASLLFLVAPRPPFVGGQSTALATRYEAIEEALGGRRPADRRRGPIIHELPGLARRRDRRPGAGAAERVARSSSTSPPTSAAGCSSWSATSTATGRRSSTPAARRADCFDEVELTPPDDPEGRRPREDPLFEVACP